MIEQRINDDYKTSMLARDAARSAAISFLRAQLKNYKIDVKRNEALTDEDVIIVIKKQVKQRQDSIAQFQQAGRLELVEKEQKELDILKNYLPQEISRDELAGIVKDVIATEKATSVKDMGRVMKVVLSKVGGRADNAMVSQIVKELLGAA